MSDACAVRHAEPYDWAWVEARLRRRWGGPTMVSRGVSHDVRRCPTLVAETGGAPSGFLAYALTPPQCEVVVIDAFERFRGVGTALMAAVVREARHAHCGRLWLVTTNDNLDALRFYQRRGMTLSALHRHAISEARRVKPAIPSVGYYGILIRDEIELEQLL